MVKRSKQMGIGRALVRTAVVLAWLPALAGCFQLGALGSVGYAVQSDDSFFGLARPLRFAEGARATLKLSAQGPKTQTVGAIVSTHPEILAVERDESGIHLHAISEGDTRLWVEVNGSRDVLDVRVDKVASVNMKSIAEDRHVAALVGQSARYNLAVLDASDKELLAPSAMPVTVSPSDLGHVMVRPDETQGIEVQLDKAGQARIGGEHGLSLIVDVIGPSDIQGVAVFEELPPEEEQKKSRDDPHEPFGAFFLRVDVDVIGRREPLASDGALLFSQTPHVCTELDADGKAYIRKLFGSGVIAVRILETGNCQVELQVGEHKTSFARHVEAPKNRRD